VGDYRIVFDLNVEKQEVYILIIAHRREVYQLVGKRYSFRT
jgi:mRNA-degrading endonuclease RelE of RelBE toxin-antitoxin system